MLRWTSVCLIIAGSIIHLGAQDRRALEQQRTALLKRIDQTNALIQKSKKNQEATMADINTLKAEMDLRRQVLKTLSSEVALVDAEARDKAQTVDELQDKMEQLRNLHASYLKSAYIRKRTENRAMFLLSAADLNQAFARWRYLRAFKIARERTFEALRSSRDSVSLELARLELLRGEKQTLVEDVNQQETELASARQASEQKLKSLRSDEDKLKRDLERQKKESARLAAEIEAVIKAEIAKNERGASLPNAPELIALSAEFESNKGKLPWPVDRGIITGRFGTQPHPVIPSIKIANNGIDITAPAGARVKALFGGKVVGKKQIPGFDLTVIIQHGSYYTVYSRLSIASVNLGDEVTTGQTIGQLSADQGTNGKLHIEVWKDKTQQDPELWIRK